MALSNDFSKYLTKKLSGLTTNKINKTGSLEFGSLTSVNKYLSIFEKAENDVSKINYEEVLKALNEGTIDGLADESTQSVATVLNELLAIDDINKAVDTSEDGDVDAAELEAFVKKLAGTDGDEKTITMDDINELFNQMGIDLDAVAEEAISEAIKEAEGEEDSIEIKKKEEEEKVEEAENKTSAASNGGGNVGGGYSSGGGSGNVNTNYGRGASNEVKAKTPEEIQKQIDDKNTEITNIEKEAEQAIQEQEKAKEEFLKQQGLSEKEYEEYKKKDAELDKEIQAKEDGINEKDDEINDNKSTISSNNNYIASLEAQIAANNARKSNLKGDNADSQKADIETKNANLTAQKQKLEQENKTLEAKNQKAEQDKQKLETEKQALEKEKAELLQNTLTASHSAGNFAAGIRDENGVKATKESAQKFDTKIQEIKSKKASDVSTIKGEIQTLQTELKDAKAREEREKFIKDNKGVNSLGVSGEELAEIAKTAGGARGTQGWCLAGVNDTLAAAYGEEYRIGEPSAYLAVSHMDAYVEEGKFDDITDQFSCYEDLRDNAPAGAIIVWENSSSHVHGHICVAMGNGQGEISDHGSSYIYNIGTKYHVYYPT